MHELGIANSVLEAVRAEVARRPGSIPVTIAVRVGGLSGIDPDALSFSFEALTAGTEWQSLKLEIEKMPREHRCRECGAAFSVQGSDFICPSCGRFSADCVGGDELELLYVELEES